jgi:hypothetical protein
MSNVRYTFSVQTFYALKPTQRIILLPYLIFSIAIYFTFTSPCHAEKIQTDSAIQAIQNEKRWSLSINNSLVSLDAQKVDVRTLFEAISTRTGIKIETNSHVNGEISISFHDIPLEEALKKIGLNHGIVFKRKKGENEYHISKVTIFSSSRNRDKNHIKLNISHQEVSKTPPNNSIKPISQVKKTDPQKRHTTSLMIVDQKTGIKSNVVSNELIVRFKKECSAEEIQTGRDELRDTAQTSNQLECIRLCPSKRIT